MNSGESHWLSGVSLVMAYVLVSVGFFFHTDTRYDAPPPLLDLVGDLDPQSGVS